MRHTPGPWIVNPDTFGTGKYPAEGLSVRGCNSEGVNMIAFLWTTSVEEEQSANANLIAAAPDLLEALLCMLHPLRKGPEAVDKAIAAVKKAQGGTP